MEISNNLARIFTAGFREIATVVNRLKKKDEVLDSSVTYLPKLYKVGEFIKQY